MKAKKGRPVSGYLFSYTTPAANPTDPEQDCKRLGVSSQGCDPFRKRKTPTAEELKEANVIPSACFWCLCNVEDRQFTASVACRTRSDQTTAGQRPAGGKFSKRRYTLI